MDVDTRATLSITLENIPNGSYHTNDDARTSLELNLALTWFSKLRLSQEYSH
jgi:hypothetical protein